MQVKRENTSATSVKLTIQADQAVLNRIHTDVVTRLSRGVKVPGFRAGKAPRALVEKQLDQTALQTAFLEEAVNELYVQAVGEEKVRPVARPQVSISKFVPFSQLEVIAEVEAVGEIKLPDYKKIKLAKPAVKVEDKDVKEVLANLRLRAAAKEDVDRAAKDGDQAWIDFTGADAKTGEPIQGADGKEYPLVLGSNTFIPGFEENLVGVKPGEKKEFTLTFPKDYGVKTLQNRKVAFTVTVTKVQEVVQPKLDDKFAASVGPFKSLSELKSDIKKQLQSERQTEADRQYENELLQKIAEKSTIAVPTVLIEDEIDRIEEEEKRNLVYRGQTWAEHLQEEGVTEAEHRDKNREGAELRVKAGLALGEIAEREGITVTPEELELRLQLLKGRYTDAAMQAELDKPENRREIASRLLSEKTLDKLKSYAASK